MKYKWRLAFLGVTALAIAMELFSIFDGNAETEPWTTLIITYIPEWAFWTFLVGGVAWVVMHFKKWYSVTRK